jgi:hypothetical protein
MQPGAGVKVLDPNRSFGLLLGAACAIAGVLAYRAGRGSDIAWAVAAIVLVAIALVVPGVLTPARRGWLGIGHWLGVVINPIVLGAVYVVVFVPFGLVMRLFGRDPMARRFDPAAASYWIARKPSGNVADGLRDQF